MKKGMRVDVKFEKLQNSTSNANFKKTAQNAKKIAVNSIINSKRGGEKHKSFRKASSLPGDPPANQTDVLASSIMFRTDFKSKYYKRFSLISKLPQAVLLELGTSDMEARPFLSPAIDTALINYNQTFSKTNDFFK